MNWIYRKKEINDLQDFPKGAFGFIYEIKFNNGKKYLGYKFLYHNKKLKPLKGKKRARRKVVESDWLTYCGSIKDNEIKAKIKSGEIYPVKKDILKVCYHKKQLSYYEVKYLFIRNCLEKEEYYNSNILGKFFKKDTKNKI